MPRLIDSEKLGLTDFEIVMCDGDYKEALKMVLGKIEDAPTVDAVPVVRCKDCKWWKTKYMRNGKRKVCVIEAYEPVRNEDEYCSWAERREDAKID
jgi:hypothetical protein